jgi:hypothetical protein
MRATAAAAIVVSLAISGTAAPQVRDLGSPPPTGTGVIMGRVTSTEGGVKPLRRVMISATSSTVRRPRTTTTDDDGRYVIDGLPDDLYTVMASKPAYVTTWAGAKPGEAVPQPGVEIVNSQRARADVVMLRGAVITGSIVEPNGRPRQSQGVVALTVRTVNGKRSAARGFGGGSATTDDRGQFRIFGLAPGEYVLSTGSQFSGSSSAPIVTDEELKWARLQLAAASSSSAPATPLAPTPPPAARPVGYSPVFYPGTADLSAATIVTVTAGEQRDGLEIVLAAVPLAKIEGTITNADGSIPASVQLVLSSAPGNGLPNASFGSTVRPSTRDGTFSFPNLQPGAYSVLARFIPSPPAREAAPAPAPRPLSMYAKADVDVNGQDVTGVSLVMQPSLTMSGRFSIDPSAQGTVDWARVRPGLAPVQPSLSASSIANVTADGSFTLSDVIPNQFRLIVGLPSGWGVKSATVAGVDFTDAPLTVAPGQNLGDASIVLTNKLASLSGKLVDGAGKGLAYTLIIFSTDRTLWSLRSRRTQQMRAKDTGEYAFSGLAAGDYYFVALSDPQAVDLTDSDSFEALAAAASKVTLAEGEKKLLSFTIKAGG